MIELNVEQNSPEWFAARVGIPTSSNFDKIVTTKGAASKSAVKYMYQLAGERIIKQKAKTYHSKTMDEALVTEVEAREFYELTRDTKIAPVGFCYKDEKKKVGCSPDGLIGDDGMIEIKCPDLHTHVGYLINENLMVEYYQQVQGQLFVTGRKWCDLMSYHPGIKPFIVRATPNEPFHVALKFELDLFSLELDRITEKIR